MLKGLKCAICKKGIMVGHNVSHAKNRTRKIFKPNLHMARVTINGVTRRVKLCTKCLRTIKKEMKSKVVEVSTEPPFVASA
ncbi:MAG: 50S ribosomal protein L28 [Candidatus Levybacteria bacterium]|nr:50S ribosomal protein L28 [Candidatus Levybacteria bacterium]